MYNMATYYGKRLLETLREEGFTEVCNISIKFLLQKLNPEYPFKFFTLKNHLKNYILYAAPPDPYKTIEIRPSEIEYRVSWFNNNTPLKPVQYRGLARTKVGSWDKNKKKRK